MLRQITSKIIFYNNDIIYKTCGRNYIKPPTWMGNSNFLKKENLLNQKSFKELQIEEGIKNEPMVTKPNIGASISKITISSKLKFQKHNANRKDTELEKAARHGTLEISLDEVNKEWLKTSAPNHLYTIIDHYGIYNDMFNGAYFYPIMPMSIGYELDEDNVMPVHYGNTVNASETHEEPLVEYDSDGGSLWTLILSNPDGYLYDSNKECLHWMIGNIPEDNIDKGETICNYLSPFPPKGIGYQRLVFTLYKQDGQINFNELNIKNTNSLSDRCFKSSDFLKKYQDHLTPYSLRFYQCKWDPSVREVYHNILNMEEPEFEYKHPVPYHPKQLLYPKHKDAFDLQIDRYRDKKDLAEEVLKLRLKDVSPFKPNPEPPKYPHIHYPEGYEPYWFRRRKYQMKRKIGHYRDLL